jgi:hypothetical protein
MIDIKLEPKISWMALTQLLLSHGYKYVVERANQFQDEVVIKLVVSENYPDRGDNLTFGRGLIGSALNNEKLEDACKPQKVLAYYNMTHCELISCCMNMYTHIEKFRKAKKQIVVTSDELIMST